MSPTDVFAPDPTNGEEFMAGYFCLWIAEFPAWALAQEDSELARKPFVVREKGKITAVSALAFAAGVRSGMTAKRAISLCAALTFVERNATLEKIQWLEIQRSVHAQTSQIEAASPGLLFAQVEPQKMLSLVHTLQAQGGQSSNRATAQLAALTAELGEVRCIRKGREASFADRIPLDNLRATQISRATLKRMKWLNWENVGALRGLTQSQIEEEVGPEGAMLFHLAQGPLLSDNFRPIRDWTPFEEIAVQKSFDLPAVEPSQWESELESLLRLALRQLGNRTAHSFEVTAQTAINAVSSRQLFQISISELATLQEPAREALKSALNTLLPLPPVVTGLEVRLGYLSDSSHPENRIPDEVSNDRSSPLLWRRHIQRVERNIVTLSASLARWSMHFAIEGMAPAKTFVPKKVVS